MNIKLENLKGKKVLVIGDLILDNYHIGDVKRISPEAPVPIVRINRTYTVLGGAANVARNLIGLGSIPYIIGLVGDDQNGKTMQNMFSELKINVQLGTTSSPTITKTRILGNNQQIVRIDFEEEKANITKQNEQIILNAISEMVPLVDAVIISDYNKGVCNDAVCKHAITTAKSHNKNIIVDPKGSNWEKYRGATIITPNLKELADVSSMEIKNEDNIICHAAKNTLNKYNLAALLVTRSEKGMSYIAPDTSVHISTEAKEVFDVSGAGDTVVATLTASLAAGFSVMESIYLANKAAGVVVGKIGTSPILLSELESKLTTVNLNKKIIAASELEDLLKMLKTQNRKIVFTNGCFDILHKGHVIYLEKAKSMGDVLIVGLNSDSSVKRLKGETRPINDEVSRGVVMAALASVDYVVTFSEDTPLNLIKTVAPDILAKGGDYNIENIVGREYAKETVTIPFVEGFSTTNILSKI